MQELNLNINLIKLYFAGTYTVETKYRDNTLICILQELFLVN